MWIWYGVCLGLGVGVWDRMVSGGIIFRGFFLIPRGGLIQDAGLVFGLVGTATKMGA